ncbi:hypothetical protein D3C71_1191680 [compost metagenome]
MQLRRCRTEAGDEQTLQLARAQAHRRCQRRGRLVLQDAFVEQGQGAVQGVVLQQAGIVGRQLRPAAQAGPITGGRGCGGARVVADIARARRRRRAHRPAIDAGGAHGGEEQPIKTRIAGQAGLFALIVGGHGWGVHGASLGP